MWLGVFPSQIYELRCIANELISHFSLSLYCLAFVYLLMNGANSSHKLNVKLPINVTALLYFTTQHLSKSLIFTIFFCFHFFLTLSSMILFFSIYSYWTQGWYRKTIQDCRNKDTQKGCSWMIMYHCGLCQYWVQEGVCKEMISVCKPMDIFAVSPCNVLKCYNAFFINICVLFF